MTDRISAVLLTIVVAGFCLVAISQSYGQTEDATTPPATVEPAPVPGDVAPPTSADVPGAVAPEEESGRVQALENGHWLVALGGVVLVLVGVARKLLQPKSRWAKLVLAGAIAAAATLGAAWESGAGWSWALIGTAFGAAWAAAGMSEHVKDVAGRPRAAGE